MAKQTFTTGSVLTATQMNNLQANDYNWTVSQKTASYVLVAADVGTRIEMNAAGATTVTVNTGLFNAGDTLFIQNIGAGACTVTAGTATVNKATAGSLTLAQYQGGTLYFVSASSAVFFADAGYTPPLTTKGDLFTYDTTNTRLPVGTNDQFLVADSTTSTGLKWATVATGGMTLISTTSMSGSATINLTLSSGYKNLQIWLEGVSTTVGAGGCQLYYWYPGGVGAGPGYSTQVYGTGPTNNSQAQISGELFGRGLKATGANAIAVVDIYDYSATTGYKIVDMKSSYIDNSSNNVMDRRNIMVPISSALTQVQIGVTNGGSSFNGGTVYLYGVK